MLILFIVCAIVNIIVIVSLAYNALKGNKKFIISQLLFVITIAIMSQTVLIDVIHWISVNDMSALLDVIPTLSRLLFYYTIVALIINTTCSIIYYKKVN